MKRKILITGGTGLVGSHLLLILSNHSELELFASKRATSDLNIVKRLFDWHNNPNFDQVQWKTADLEIDQWHDIENEHFDEIIHTAAVVSFNPKDFDLMHKVNINATENLLSFAKRTSVRKFGFISSITSLGRVAGESVYTENSAWQDNAVNSEYSKTKYRSEQFVLAANSDDLNTYIVNPGVILGPCDWNKSSGTFFRTGAKGMKFYTKGQNGFVDVNDVAKGILTVMEKGNPGERHILVGENISYKKVFELLTQGFGSTIPTIYANKLLTDIGWRLDKLISSLKKTEPTLTKESARTSHGFHTYDNNKVQQQLGFQFTPIEASIKQSIPYFKQYYA